MRISFLWVALGLAVALAGSSARADAARPAAAPTELPIWPGPAPDAPASAAAMVETSERSRDLIAGKPIEVVRNVTRPTLTVYPPAGRNTGAAVIVFPGGGYKALAMDLEGTEACDWLTARGVTCAVLKYRVPDSGPHWDSRCKCQVTPPVLTALQDAQRALSLVRAHAAAWHVDPHKVGVLGFSAGGHLSAAASTHFARRAYAAVDAVDQQSCRPDFAVLVYPGHLWIDEDKFELNPDIQVTKETPPTFLVQAENDDVDDVRHSLVYYLALQKAGVPVEMHLYAQGGHAFGLRPAAAPITRWPQLVERWLQTLGVLGR